MRRVVDEELRGKVYRWLLKHDRQLWYDKVKVEAGRQRLEKAIGQEVPMRLFRELRGSTCKWWKKIPRRNFTSLRALDWRQWNAYYVFALNNKDLLAACDSIEFAAAVVASVGKLPCSPELLRSGCSFMQVWRELHPEQFDPEGDQKRRRRV